MPPCPSSPCLLSALRTEYHIPCPEVSRSMTAYKAACPGMRFWVYPLVPLSSVFVQHGSASSTLFLLWLVPPQISRHKAPGNTGTQPQLSETQTGHAQASHRGCWSRQGQHWQMPTCSQPLSQHQCTNSTRAHTWLEASQLLPRRAGAWGPLFPADV